MLPVNPARLQQIALSVAEARSLPDTLHTIVDALFATPDTALARIWLKAPGDVCDSCPMRAECDDQTECLHLAASAGAPLTGSTQRWDRLDGRFRRMPMGARKVGRIGKADEPELHDRVDGDSWLADPQWATTEGICAFAGQPMRARGQALGVLAVFSRRSLTADDLVWLRTLADHAAVAIANARAFDEIEELRKRLQLQRDYLRDEAKPGKHIIGASKALRASLASVERVAPTDASVLIEAESGAGKELFAQAIHDQSPRREHALVRVNCAAVPKELFESEFFGHVRGSFTGATTDRDGRFAVADGSTMFLDEVGEIPLDLQSKLLRVLQEGTFERIGATKTTTVDVRIVAATNRDLKQEVAAGTFREDLYYRLSVFPIRLPPLRERTADIADLARHFIALACSRFHKPELQFDGAQLRALEGYSWPGNVRELQSVIDRAVILSDGDRLPLELALPELRASASPATAPAGAGDASGFVSDQVMRQRERANVLAALEHADWKVYGDNGAASLLGLKGSTLASRMRSLAIDKSHRDGS